MLCLLFFFLLGCSSAQNNLGDLCTNECQPGDPLAWCGERRFDQAGRVVRCVQGSKHGLECVDSCTAKNESYFWCWTNAQNVVSDYWEKCGTSKGDQSFTVKGVPCQSGCEMKTKTVTEDYWWCRDDDQDPSSWDYCSPPGQVRPVQYTRHGHACLGTCAQHGENYWWCSKSRRWAGTAAGICETKKDICTEGQAEDEWWEYCSPSKHRTRYNEPCREPCASRGESYFWCYTASSWDYCSPEPDIVQETRTRSGLTCNGICDKMSSSYFFCETKMATGWTGSWWDYCSKS